MGLSGGGPALGSPLEDPESSVCGMSTIAAEELKEDAEELFGLKLTKIDRAGAAGGVRSPRSERRRIRGPHGDLAYYARG